MKWYEQDETICEDIEREDGTATDHGASRLEMAYAKMMKRCGRDRDLQRTYRDGAC
ncbi:hypothetical protein KIN20_033402 [Parelaphostrongylus tenuis]|uniref:Uncharacterized protein n=1 Tax=Parelaphostrongylus tenuis TaxID=148309 RepID=A0AAD5WIU7_PARTN|nr:hypothetical protein KIN20_033402 [Parelaphostrongylus tenuis]